MVPYATLRLRLFPHLRWGVCELFNQKPYHPLTLFYPFSYPPFYKYSAKLASNISAFPHYCTINECTGLKKSENHFHVLFSAESKSSKSIKHHQYIPIDADLSFIRHIIYSAHTKMFHLNHNIPHCLCNYILHKLCTQLSRGLY